MKRISFSDDMPLAEVRKLVMDSAYEGVKCPCCGRLVKFYRRKIHAEMCVWLAGLANISETSGSYYTTEEIVKVTRHLSSWGTDGARLRYWGLIDKIGQKNLAGAPAGSYRILEAGVEFLRGTRSVARYVYLFNGEVVAFDKEMVSIHECVSEKFKYEDLMKIVEG